jgi:hypothetical protein
MFLQKILTFLAVTVSLMGYLDAIAAEEWAMAHAGIPDGQMLNIRIIHLV